MSKSYNAVAVALCSEAKLDANGCSDGRVGWDVVFGELDNSKNATDNANTVNKRAHVG